MKKYCDYYYTTKRHLLGERNNSTPRYGYSWTIWNAKCQQLQSSLDNTEESDMYFDSKEIAEQQVKEAIQDHYV